MALAVIRDDSASLKAAPNTDVSLFQTVSCCCLFFGVLMIVVVVAVVVSFCCYRAWLFVVALCVSHDCEMTVA